MVVLGMPQKIRAVGSVKMTRWFFSGRRMCRRPWSMSTRGVPLLGRTATTSARVIDLSESLSWSAHAWRAGSALVTIR
ncbi:hypothetical protein BIV24_17410 [Streptomyces colonosanans]|uniref:Uncharacterized protein n=1 Tax=Streptomyces colonosanans TaxID=1428652 RepID=A0A1S2PBY4_9ACTN|nr:hypothetical protein BIV24_17410 [Streptomyces colonosanans]